MRAPEETPTSRMGLGQPGQVSEGMKWSVRRSVTGKVELGISGIQAVCKGRVVTQIELRNAQV